MGSLASELERRRAESFVGRKRELARLGRMLGEEPGPRVAYVHGPGGIGKTALMHAFCRLARAEGLKVASVSAEYVGPSAFAVEEALYAQLGIRRIEDAADEALVLVIDAAELIDGMDPWLRHSFLPRLPASVRLLLTTREAPSVRMRTDPGWNELVQILGLRYLSDDEAMSYLVARGIQDKHFEAILSRTHGHPLALALCVEVALRDPERELSFDTAPDIVRSLLKRLLDGTETEAHRRALELCCIARSTSESTIRAVFPGESASELFSWLESRSFISHEPHGLVPHHVVRDVVTTDFARRDPDRFREVHERLQEHYTVLAGDPNDVRFDDSTALVDLVYLHRRHQALSRLFSFEPHAQCWADRAAEEDLQQMEALQQSESQRAALRWVRHWWQASPQSLTAFRNESGEVVGYESVLTVTSSSLESLAEDPALTEVCEYLKRRAPLREGEVAQITRAWGQHGGQVMGDVQSQMWLHRMQELARTPGLAVSVTLFEAPDLWAPGFLYMRFVRTTELDFETSRERGGGFVKDWRLESLVQWGERLAQQAVGAPPPSAQEQAPVMILSRERFASATKRALADYPDRAKLGSNPLAQSRLVLREMPSNATAEQKAERLAELLEAAIDSLREPAEHRKAHQALMRTFVTPAPTQALAAERLGLPFSTFRRHLRKGIEQVADHLWSLEVR